MAGIAIVGLQHHESEWVRILVDLLRDSDPAVVEMTQHALLYVRELAQHSPEKQAVGNHR